MDRKQIVKKQAQQYVNFTRVQKDSDQVLNRYPALQPSSDVVLVNGKMQTVLVFSGTIPVQYRGSTYNIPICVKIPPPYPNSPPFCMVQPTSNMVIRPSVNVDQSGQYIHPCVGREWNRNDYSLVSIIEKMQAAFSIEPPVYSRRSASPSPSISSVGSGTSSSYQQSSSQPFQNQHSYQQQSASSGGYVTSPTNAGSPYLPSFGQQQYPQSGPYNMSTLSSSLSVPASLQSSRPTGAASNSESLPAYQPSYNPYSTTSNTLPHRPQSEHTYSQPGAVYNSTTGRPYGGSNTLNIPSRHSNTGQQSASLTNLSMPEAVNLQSPPPLGELRRQNSSSSAYTASSQQPSALQRPQQQGQSQQYQQQPVIDEDAIMVISMKSALLDKVKRFKEDQKQIVDTSELQSLGYVQPDSDCGVNLLLDLNQKLLQSQESTERELQSIRSESYQYRKWKDQIDAKCQELVQYLDVQAKQLQQAQSDRQSIAVVDQLIPIIPSIQPQQVLVTSKVANQLIEVVSEDLALQDLMYTVSQAFYNDAIKDDAAYLKQVRKLSNDQFSQRALIFKIRHSIGLPPL
ncbi:hypothetical protein MP228_009937 [Amoeboaphelidium protococcarum]|nr:hypothetical protein MP228_009937 [Amoeboaphelidium protococcarum]